MHAKVDVGFMVAGADAPHIVYPAAVVRSSRAKPAAVKFLEFLCGDAAATVFTRHRFIPLRCHSQGGASARGPAQYEGAAQGSGGR
jgi:ABC-type Fe3+ transport system substrate-binding protein